MNTLAILLSAITAFLATMSSGIFIHKYQKNIGVVCAFSAGVLIALALLDILPDMMTLAPKTQVSLVIPITTMIIGFFSLYALDYGFTKTSKTDAGRSDKVLNRTVGLLSTSEFCFHGFLEGLAIGVSFQFEWSLGIVVALAVISHDFCDGVSTLILMLNSGNTARSSMTMLFLDAVAPVLGAVTTLFFTVQDIFVLFALSFLAGSFFYMGGGSLLPQAHQKNRPIVTVAFFLLGLLLILFFSTLLQG